MILYRLWHDQIQNCGNEKNENKLDTNEINERDEKREDLLPINQLLIKEFEHIKTISVKLLKNINVGMSNIRKDKGKSLNKNSSVFIKHLGEHVIRDLTQAYIDQLTAYANLIKKYTERQARDSKDVTQKAALNSNAA